MSFWSRIANVFRGDDLSREIDEELEAHIADAIEAGRDPAEARRAFGSVLRRGEESREIRLIAWLECLRADTIFGWRQIRKNKLASAAAVLSLATGDRRVHIGVPPHRRLAAAAFAGGSSRAALRPCTARNRMGWRSGNIRRMGVPGLSTDARGCQG